MRLSEHPILDFDRGERITFYYNGQEIEGYTEETIAAALLPQESVAWATAMSLAAPEDCSAQSATALPAL